MNQVAYPKIVVKRIRLLQHLIEKGFTEYEIIPDPTSHKGYNWFVFKNSPELKEVVDTYFANLKK